MLFAKLIHFVTLATLDSVNTSVGVALHDRLISSGKGWTKDSYLGSGLFPSGKAIKQSNGSRDQQYGDEDSVVGDMKLGVENRHFEVM